MRGARLAALFALGILCGCTANSAEKQDIAWQHMDAGDIEMKFKSPNPAVAARYYRLAAESGNEWGQLKMGELYEAGKGVPRSLPRAIAWYRQAAAQNNPWAQARLGELYADGTGVPRNEALAIRYLQASLSVDNEWSEVKLGQLLKRRDPARARAYFQSAAAKGNAEARQELRSLR